MTWDVQRKVLPRWEGAAAASWCQERWVVHGSWRGACMGRASSSAGLNRDVELLGAASGEPEANRAWEMPKEKLISDTSLGDGCPEGEGGKISFTAEHK